MEPPWCGDPFGEPLVGGFRERYDSSAAYGMPAHVTVLYPFLPWERAGRSRMPVDNVTALGVGADRIARTSDRGRASG